MKDQDLTDSNSVLWATSASLNFFWVLNIFKESFKDVKNFLNFYPPTGPLLGLFTFSIFVFIVVLFGLKLIRIRNQKFSFWAILISSILFLIMVFPPVFKIIVDQLK
ncbi:hypothetical protein HYS93_04510 [Candidatus Daviesbacteria bacterium]|nr:hypothetical protein [Candidatus Daviesbacteria bacterium]